MQKNCLGSTLKKTHQVAKYQFKCTMYAVNISTSTTLCWKVKRALFELRKAKDPLKDNRNHFQMSVAILRPILTIAKTVQVICDQGKTSWTYRAWRSPWWGDCWMISSDWGLTSKYYHVIVRVYRICFFCLSDFFSTFYSVLLLTTQFQRCHCIRYWTLHPSPCKSWDDCQLPPPPACYGAKTGQPQVLSPFPSSRWPPIPPCMPPPKFSHLSIS